MGWNHQLEITWEGEGYSSSLDHLLTFSLMFMVNVGKYTMHGSYGH